MVAGRRRHAPEQLFDPDFGSIGLGGRATPGPGVLQGLEIRNYLVGRVGHAPFANNMVSPAPYKSEIPHSE